MIALAVPAGTHQPWSEDVLGRYLRGSITRQEAIDALGVDWVALAERQQQAVQEDMEWGLTSEDGQPSGTKHTLRNPPDC